MSGRGRERFTGQVALVTGAAQGQGREHAVALAREGADIIVVDICAQVEFVPYSMGTAEGLAETARLIEDTGRRVVARRVDVRDRAALSDAVADGVGELGRLDVVVANAAITSVQRFEDVTADVWDATIGTNLTGVWHTCAVSIPHLLASGGGSITIISSSAGLRGLPFYLPYATAKHGLVGLARSLALELADRNIRVNTVHPTGVDTAQGHSTVLPRLLDERPDLRPAFHNALPISHVQPRDVTHAVLYLASDEARYVTASALSVDAGAVAL